MIIIFVLLWFSAVGGMEQEMPVQKELSSVLSLKEIAVRAVCSHLVDKKISIDQVRQKLPNDIVKLIETQKACFIKYKDIYHYFSHTITPDHRYMLVMGKQGLLRLDLWMNRGKKSLTSGNLLVALSSSGNLVALLSSNKLWIKDIAQNKVIAETADLLLGVPNRYAQSISFIGENKLLLFIPGYLICLSFDKNFNLHGKFSFGMNNNNLIGILPTSQECIIYKKGAFLRTTLKGKGAVKNSTTVKDLKSLPEFVGKPIIYEPDMLIAYSYYDKGVNKENIEIVSLKDWPEITKLVACPNGGGEVRELAFANKGKWLIIVGEWYTVDGSKKNKYGITIWDWQHNQKLAKLAWEDRISHLSYTDQPTPYPCLFESIFEYHNQLYSFEPIKVVAAAMLLNNQSQQAVATSNNNSNNNNNNVSNDNGPKPKTSPKIGKCAVS